MIDFDQITPDTTGLTAFDLIGYDGPYYVRIVGGRTRYDAVLTRDGYVGGNVRLARIDTTDGLRQINRYVGPDTPVELVDDDRTLAQQQADSDAARLAEVAEVIADHVAGDFDADDAIERITHIIEGEAA